MTKSVKERAKEILRSHGLNKNNGCWGPILQSVSSVLKGRITYSNVADTIQGFLEKSATCNAVRVEKAANEVLNMAIEEKLERDTVRHLVPMPELITRVMNRFHWDPEDKSIRQLLRDLSYKAINCEIHDDQALVLERIAKNLPGLKQASNNLIDMCREMVVQARIRNRTRLAAQEVKRPEMECQTSEVKRLMGVIKNANASIDVLSRHHAEASKKVQELEMVLRSLQKANKTLCTAIDLHQSTTAAHAAFTWGKVTEAWQVAKKFI